MLKLFNTLSRKVEEFKPTKPPHVGMYTCGQTVYDYTHIGHLRKYIGDDLLRRVLVANGFDVKHVQNVTDVGHLTSDADEGDDKLEKGAKDRGETVWEVANFFTDYFYKSLEQVNVLRPHVVCRATEHIGEQIKLIEKLVKKSFTYQTEEAIYFNIAKFPSYGKLSGQKLEEQKTGARKEVVVDKAKKHPQDFALWFFTVGKFKDHTMRWPSPWGEGFPGWHIECSAMSMEYLGDSLDIHTGGVDHIPVHHENEIAQSEGAIGKPFVKYWVHHEFLVVDGEKMSKSKKNFYTIDDVKEKGFDPLALRYLFLTAHYRDKLNFTWKSLGAAQAALNKLREEIRPWQQPKGGSGQYWQKFLEAANNDLNLPQAVAVLWQMVHSNPSTSSRVQDLVEMDKILGLGLDQYLGKPLEVPKNIMELVEKRENLRKAGNFKKADELRKEVKKQGFEIEDTPGGPKIQAS
ncbi:cysteine--tRNA ligase [Candidatus Daviesbacteria bacterium]|nr:cysteine--tRNA ligase [Candidatus Daviesbacteria bacterium]